MIKCYINPAEIRHWVAPTLATKILKQKFLFEFAKELSTLDWRLIAADYKRYYLYGEKQQDGYWNKTIPSRVEKRYSVIIKRFEKKLKHYIKASSLEKTINELMLGKKLEEWRSIYVRYGSGTIKNLAESLCADIVFDIEEISDKDVVIIRNIGDHTRDFIKNRLSLKDPRLIFVDVAYYTPFENKYIQRVGIDGFVHSNYKDCDDSRMWMFEDCLEDWKDYDGPILLIPPEGHTCEVYDIKTNNWINEVTDRIKRQTKKEIIVRTKPNKKDRVKDSLEDFCKNNKVSMVVTHSSTAAIQTIMWGIPSIATEKCPVSAYFDGLDKINSWEKKDRNKFLQWLSHCQFTIDEIESGEAILKVIEDNIS